MQIAQKVLLPFIDLTVERRISIVYTPVYTVPLEHLSRNGSVPAKLVVVLTTKYSCLGFLFRKETERLFSVDTFFKDHEFWSKVAEFGAQLRKEHPWAAKFFYGTLREIKLNKDLMLTNSKAQ